MTGDAGKAGAEPRLAAWRLLGDVRRQEYADRAARRRLCSLQGRDRALAREIAYGAIRLRGRLDAELEVFLERPVERIEADTLDWLRLGLYQLRETRIPDHAAVSETVGGARRTGTRGAAGLVNAVLRRAAREGRPEHAFPKLDRDPVGYLTTWGSHPRWLVQRWISRWPLASVRRLVENDNRAPPVTVRWLDASRAPGDVTGGAGGIRLTPLEGWPSVFRLDEGDPGAVVGTLPAVVQDPAASTVVDYVGRDVRGPVADLCAAPGGKSMGLAFMVPGARPFVAADISARRLERLSRMAHRLSADVRLVRMDARAPAVSAARTVVLDAPCTGTGVLRRRVDARWRATPRRLGALVELQREMLDAAALVTEPGGLLVYATCSLEPEENERQVDAFLARHRDYRREPPRAWTSAPAIDEAGDLRVLPWLGDSDGAYASRLRRTPPTGSVERGSRE